MSEPTNGEAVAGCGCLIALTLLTVAAFGWAWAVGYAIGNGLFG